MKPISPDDPVLDTVRQIIAREAMITPGTRVLAAVSGGPDSVCLLHALWTLGARDGFTVCAAHLNHCLRGAESDGDEAFVKDLARKIGIRCQTARKDIGARDAPGSQEDRARIARYAFLHRTAATLNCTRIATGHTQDDQAETVLMRLLRGTGPDGLAGVHPVREDGVVRPLLDVTRADVMAYLKRNCLPYRTDRTNAGIAYFRNRVRHRLLPYIKKHFRADVTARLAGTAHLARMDAHGWDEAVTRCFTKALILKGSYTIILDIQKLGSYNDSIISRIIRRSLQFSAKDPAGAEQKHVQAVRDALAAGVPWLGDLPGGITAEVCRAGLVFVRHAGKPLRRRYLPVPGRVVLPGGAGTLITEEVPRSALRSNLKSYPPHIGLVDADLLRGRPAVRERRPGDRLFPLGARGGKRLKVFLNECGVPRSLRDRLPLIVEGKNIVWVAGLRPDERYKVTERTQRVLKMIYEEDGTRHE